MTWEITPLSFDNTTRSLLPRLLFAVPASVLKVALSLTVSAPVSTVLPLTANAVVPGTSVAMLTPVRRARSTGVGTEGSKALAIPTRSRSPVEAAVPTTSSPAVESWVVLICSIEFSMAAAPPITIGLS